MPPLLWVVRWRYALEGRQDAAPPLGLRVTLSAALALENRTEIYVPEDGDAGVGKWYSMRVAADKRGDG